MGENGIGVLGIGIGLLIGLIYFTLTPSFDEGYDEGFTDAVRASHIHVNLALAKQDTCYGLGRDELVMAHIKEIAKEVEGK